MLPSDPTLRLWPCLRWLATGGWRQLLGWYHDHAFFLTWWWYCWTFIHSSKNILIVQERRAAFGAKVRTNWEVKEKQICWQKRKWGAKVQRGTLQFSPGIGLSLLTVRLQRILNLNRLKTLQSNLANLFLAFFSTVSLIKRLLKLFDWKLMCTLILEYCGDDLKPICVSDYLGCFVHSPPRPLFLM